MTTETNLTPTETAVICRYCGTAIKRDQRPNLAAGRSPTGWTHDSEKWLGNRCANGTRSAEPAGAREK